MDEQKYKDVSMCEKCGQEMVPVSPERQAYLEKQIGGSLGTIWEPKQKADNEALQSRCELYEAALRKIVANLPHENWCDYSVALSTGCNCMNSDIFYDVREALAGRGADE